MLGPIEEGSSRFDNIWTRPISVPISPIAGDTSAALRMTFAPAM